MLSRLLDKLAAAARDTQSVLTVAQELMLQRLTGSVPQLHVALPPPLSKNFERDWSRMLRKAHAEKAEGGRAISDALIDLVNRTLLSDLFPDVPYGNAAAKRPPFRRYLDLSRFLNDLATERYAHEIFIGTADQLGIPYPIYVPRHVFTNHAYIIGATGMGKTSHAVTQLLLQLAMPLALDAPAPPLLIIDMKSGGDRYLRSVAELLARVRGQKLQFYSNDPRFDGLRFNPFYLHKGGVDHTSMADFWLKAIGHIYPEGYGADYFTARQRELFHEVMRSATPPQSLTQLIKQLKEKGKKEYAKDSRHIVASLAPLEGEPTLDGELPPAESDAHIDLERFLDGNQILYLYLDPISRDIPSKQIGRLILYYLMQLAAERKHTKGVKQCYIAIDEFHNLSGRNIADLLAQSRDHGMSFLLSHQSPAQLTTKSNEDIFGLLFQLCSFFQCLTLKDERLIRQLRAIAGDTTEYRTTTGTSSGTTTGRSYGFSSGISTSRDAWGNTTSGTYAGSSSGTSESESEGSFGSSQEVVVPALTPELIVRVNHVPLLSYVHVLNAGSHTLSPVWDRPALVQGYFPFTKKRAARYSNKAWPLAPKDISDKPAPCTQSRPDAVKPTNHPASVAFIERLGKELDDLAEDGLIAGPEFKVAHQLLRPWRLSLQKLIDLGKACGIAITDVATILTPEQEARLAAARGK